MRIRTERLGRCCWTFEMQCFRNCTLSSSFFKQPTFLSGGAEDDRQIFTAGSVLGKARKLDPEISPTPPLIFTGGQKVQNLASFSTWLDFEWPAFENAARYLRSETNCKLGHDPSVFPASLVQFSPRTPEIYTVWAPVKNLTAKMC